MSEVTEMGLTAQVRPMDLVIVVAVASPIVLPDLVSY